MPRSLWLEGTLELDGPHGKVTLAARGSTLEMRVHELRRVPSLLRDLRRLQVPDMSPFLRFAGVGVLLGWRRWLPVEIRPREAVGSDPGWRVRIRPWRFGDA